MTTQEWVTVTNIQTQNPQARAILLHMKNQVDIARMQFERIRDERIKSEQLLKLHREYSALQKTMTGREREETWGKALTAYADWSKQYARIYADHQFLTIILGRLYPLSKKLKSLLNTHRELAVVWKKYHKWLKLLNECRDSMEHAEDRITKPNMEIESYLIGVGYEFMLNDKGYDINHAERELEAFFDAMIMALKD